MQPETKTRELPLVRLYQLKEIALEARSIGARKPVRPEVLSRQFWRAIVQTHAGKSLRKDQQSGSWLAQQSVEIQRSFWTAYFRSDLTTAIEFARRVRTSLGSVMQTAIEPQPKQRYIRSSKGSVLAVKRLGCTQFVVIVGDREIVTTSTSKNPNYACCAVVDEQVIFIALGSSPKRAAKNAYSKEKTRVVFQEPEYSIHPIVFGGGTHGSGRPPIAPLSGATKVIRIPIEYEKRIRELTKDGEIPRVSTGG